MTIVDRIRELELPTDEFVVIGSGVLDALGLRESGDVDLAVSNALFDQLKQQGWRSAYKDGEEYVVREGAEAWHGWSGGPPQHSFDDLLADSIVINGVHFANPRFVIDWKRQRNSAKDRTDIKLLEEYLAHGIA